MTAKQLAKDLLLTLIEHQDLPFEYRNHPDYKGLPIDWTPGDKPQIPYMRRSRQFQIRVTSP